MKLRKNYDGFVMGSVYIFQVNSAMIVPEGLVTFNGRHATLKLNREILLALA